MPPAVMENVLAAGLKTPVDGEALKDRDGDGAEPLANAMLVDTEAVKPFTTFVPSQ